MVVTQFQGEKGKSNLVHGHIKKKKLEKPEWLDITKGLCKGLSHVHMSNFTQQLKIKQCGGREAK